MKHDFICVGFPKCATTTLDAILRQHPEIALPCHKETLFFERDDLYNKGIEWYEKRYYGRKQNRYENKVVGEINPRGIANGNNEKNILRAFGKDVKIIYMIRNPVDAVFSYYKHSIVNADIYKKIEKNMWEDGCFDSFVEQYLTNKNRNEYSNRAVFANFLYGRYIATALKYVPAQNVYIILFEDFVKDTEGETKKLLQFLGADSNVSINYNIKENVGIRIPKSIGALKTAKRKLKFWHHWYVPKVPYLGNVLERRMDKWYWSISDKASIHTDVGIKMNEETKIKLKEFYKPDVEMLDQTMHTNFRERWNLG